MTSPSPTHSLGPPCRLTRTKGRVLSSLRAASNRRVKNFVPGRSIVYERAPEYWGNAVNVNVGVNNFDEMRFE